MQQNKISLFTAVLMIINIMIGGGILIGPGRMAAIAGNASFLGWPLVALIFLPIVLCTVQLSAMFPGAGGFYLYAKQGLNRQLGFIAGWLYILGYTFAAAVEILALRERLLVSAGDYWIVANHIIFGVLLVVSCVALNLLSLRLFSRILNTFTISKLLPLIILIILLPFIFNPHFTITSGELSLLPLSLPMAIFGYFGFEYCCSMSHLIVDSQKNGPRAIMLGFLGTALIYALFHFGVLNLMGANNLAQFGAPAFADFITLPIGPVINFLKILIPLAAVITLFAGANGMINANAILLQTMAEDRLIKFAYPLSRVSAWYRPWIAIVVQGVAVFVIIALMPHINIVGGICNMGILSAFVLPFVSLFILQKKEQSYRKMALTSLALFITGGLVVYSFYAIADTTTERILFTLPLVGAVFGGLFLFERS